MVQEGARRDQQLVRVALDEAAFEQRVEGAVAGRAANELDPCPRDRLAVGDDRQHFQCRSGQRNCPRIAQMPFDRGGDLGSRNQRELLTVTLDGQPERWVLEQVLVGGLQSLSGQADRRAQLL